jgi:TonB family protein
VPAKTETQKPVTPPAAPPSAAPPPVAVAAPAAPVVVETPPMAKLSQGTIASVASQHSRELAKCEGTADLHGEITVRFEVNAAGRVTKSQVSSTLKNPKVTGCILRALKTWQFPRPPTGGAAEGTYAMSYQ